MAVRILKAPPIVAEVLVYLENSNEVLFTKTFCTLADAEDFALNKFGLTRYNNQPVGHWEVRQLS